MGSLSEVDTVIKHLDGGTIKIEGPKNVRDVSGRTKSPI